MAEQNQQKIKTKSQNKSEKCMTKQKKKTLKSKNK